MTEDFLENSYSDHYQDSTQWHNLLLRLCLHCCCAEIMLVQVFHEVIASCSKSGKL